MQAHRCSTDGGSGISITGLVAAKLGVGASDRGYDNGDEGLACQGTGIRPAMPRADTSGRAKQGLFVRAAFVDAAAADHDVCPAGAVLTTSVARSDRHGDIDQCRNLEALQACALPGLCTTETVKRIKRSKHEAVLELMQRPREARRDAMAVRRATAEYVFGTLQAWKAARPS